MDFASECSDGVSDFRDVRFSVAGFPGRELNFGENALGCGRLANLIRENPVVILGTEPTRR